jgi:rhamnosyltransferase subunit B
MSHVMLLPNGSVGDVLPYVWLGRQLIQRGHVVTMASWEAYREAAEHAGLYFVAAAEVTATRAGSPDAWNPGKGMRIGHAHAGQSTPKFVAAAQEIMARHDLPRLILAPMTTFAARLLREKLGIPFISTHLDPVAFVSAHEVPGGLPAGWWLRRLPLLLRKLILAHAAPYDRFALPGVRQCCLDHGIKPPRSLRQEWYHSPDGVLALFPSWYAKPQPEWPENTFQWDFPLEDMSDLKPLAPDLKAFLDAGSKPLVFTLGSCNLHVRRFFESASAITAHFRRRAVFVTREDLQLPATLEQSVFVTRYAPLSTLLPHAETMIHHGGIGTTSLCLAAGVPQLITPLAFGQPDTAERVERLGAGLRMEIRKFSSKTGIPPLRRCLEDAAIRQAAQDCAERLRQRRPVAELTAWLEGRMCNPGTR